MDIPTAQLVAVARAEAERMRTAVAKGTADSRVTMTAPQFARLADLIALLCDRVEAAENSAGGLTIRNMKEAAVNDDVKAQGSRTLGQIEQDMISSEAAFADADKRFRQAESDRRAALEAINRHQSELDRAIGRLRQRSPDGSSWKPGREAAKPVLMLETEESSGAESGLIESPRTAAE